MKLEWNCLKIVSATCHVRLVTDYISPQKVQRNFRIIFLISSASKFSTNHCLKAADEDATPREQTLPSPLQSRPFFTDEIPMMQYSWKRASPVYIWTSFPISYVLFPRWSLTVHFVNLLSALVQFRKIQIFKGAWQPLLVCRDRLDEQKHL